MRFSGLRFQEINPLTFLAPAGQKHNIVRENISLSYVVITHKRAKKKSITIEDRIIEGIARTTTITIINKFIDDKKDELLEIWDKAQKGEKINKIR